MLHHGVAYNCLPSDESAVEALPNMGPYDRLKQGMLCEQFFMVGCCAAQCEIHRHCATAGPSPACSGTDPDGSFF